VKLSFPFFLDVTKRHWIISSWRFEKKKLSRNVRVYRSVKRRLQPRVVETSGMICQLFNQVFIKSHVSNRWLTDNYYKLFSSSILLKIFNRCSMLWQLLAADGSCWQLLAPERNSNNTFIFATYRKKFNSIQIRFLTFYNRHNIH